MILFLLLFVCVMRGVSLNLEVITVADKIYGETSFNSELFCMTTIEKVVTGSIDTLMHRLDDFVPLPVIMMHTLDFRLNHKLLPVSVIVVE